MQTQSLFGLITTILEDAKATNISTFNVTHLTEITDLMIIASGRSERHVQASSEKLVYSLKKAGVKATIEGLDDGQWVVIDFGDIVVHLMHPVTREFYQLERLWSSPTVETSQSIH